MVLLVFIDDIKAFIAGNKPAETIIKFKPLDIPQLSNELVVKSQHKNYPLLLSCLTRPDAIYLYGPTGSGKTVAVKTGTTDDKRDNWAVGYTPSAVVGVWVGNNDNSEMNPKIASGVTGATPI